MEALTAFVFASGVAIAFLFLPVERAEAALIGDISRTSTWDAVVTVIVCSGLMAAVWRIYPKLVLISISEDLAASEGIHVARCNLAYLLVVAVIVALGVKVVGGLLTAALVAIPASAARNLSHNLRQYVLGAIGIGMGSALVGIILFGLSGLPAGPLIVIVSAVIFVMTLPLTRR